MACISFRMCFDIYFVLLTLKMRFLLVVLSWFVFNTRAHSTFPKNPQTPFGGQVNLAAPKNLCSACISGLEAGKRTSWVSPRVFISEMTVACQTSRQTTPDVVSSLASLTACVHRINLTEWRSIVRRYIQRARSRHSRGS